MRYRGPDPTSKEAIAGLVARRKRREEENIRLEGLAWGLSPAYMRAVTAERWEIERERMYQERDSNEETLDRYGSL